VSSRARTPRGLRAAFIFLALSCGCARLRPELELQRDAISYALAFSPRGDALAIGGAHGRVAVVSLTGGPELTLDAHRAGPVRALAWSPDGARLATGGLDGRVLVFRGGVVERELVHDHAVLSIALVGSTIAAASARSIAVWSLVGQGPPRSFANVAVPALALSDAGDRVAGIFRAADGSIEVRVHDVASGARLATMPEVRRPRRCGLVFEGQLDPRLALRADPVLRWAATPEGLAALAIQTAGHTLSPIPAFTPDARVFALADVGGRSRSLSDLPPTLRVWSLPEGRLLGSATGPAHENPTALVFSPDGRRLAAGFDDGSVTVWETPAVR
jgi:WD40 repeat protein